jgi:hypothetical protein
MQLIDVCQNAFAKFGSWNKTCAARFTTQDGDSGVIVCALSW